MRITLVKVSADGDEHEVGVGRLPSVIGRAEGCDIRIPLASVSRQHCELLIEDEELVVRDRGSSNGTYVNGERVRERELIPGDLLAIGPVVLVVSIDGHPKEIDARAAYASGAIAGAHHEGVPAWSSGTAPTLDGGAKTDAIKTDQVEPGMKPLVGDSAEDSDLDFDLDLSDLEDDET